MLLGLEGHQDAFCAAGREMKRAPEAEENKKIRRDAENVVQYNGTMREKKKFSKTLVYCVGMAVQAKKTIVVRMEVDLKVSCESG